MNVNMIKQFTVAVEKYKMAIKAA